MARPKPRPGTFGRERNFAPAARPCWIGTPSAAKGHGHDNGDGNDDGHNSNSHNYGDGTSLNIHGDSKSDRPGAAEHEKGELKCRRPRPVGLPPSWVVLQELVPAMMKKEVMKNAQQTLRQGFAGVVVIEMLWSNTLPSHDGGRRYQNIFRKIQDALSDKNLAVTSMRPSKSCQAATALGIYDRNSAAKKEAQLLPSNQSYSGAGPSRLGAFEIHLLQPGWDAGQRCGNRAPKASHRGPPVVVPGGVWCEACAMDGQETHEAEKDERDASFKPSEADESDDEDGSLQHTLLHSKLWARSWPSSDLLAQIATVMMPKWPAERPVNLELEAEEPEVAPASILQAEQADLALPPRRRVQIPGHPDVDSEAKLQQLHELLRELAPLAAREGRDQQSHEVMVKDLLVQQNVSSPCTVTLLWGLDGKLDKSDLDLSTRVGDDTVYFGKREIGKCKLDFDHQGRGTTDRDCAENLSLGEVGTFPIIVTNFANKDGGVPIPFTLLVRRSGRTAERYEGEVMHGSPLMVCTIQVAEEDLTFSTRTKTSRKRRNREDVFKVALIDRMVSLGYHRQSCLDWFAAWPEKDIQDLHREHFAFEELTHMQAELKPQVKRQQEQTMKRKWLAQRAFIVYCRKLIECVPDHRIDLGHLDPPDSPEKENEPKRQHELKPQKAEQKVLDCSRAIESVHQAREINDRRRRIWNHWEASVEPWLKHLSPSQLSRITGGKTSETWRMDEMTEAREKLQKYVDFDDLKPLVRCQKLQHLLDKWQEAKERYRNSMIC